VTPYEREKYFELLMRELGWDNIAERAKDLAFIESIRHGGSEHYVSTFAERVQRKEAVKRLQGLPVTTIAERLGIARETVYSDLRPEEAAA
jgi:DNA-binding phage protein